MRRQTYLADITKAPVWVLTNSVESRSAYCTTLQNCCHFSKPSLFSIQYKCQVLVTKLDMLTFCTLFTILGAICVWGMPHWCIVLLVFTAESLLPFFISNSVKSFMFPLDSLDAWEDKTKTVRNTTTVLTINSRSIYFGKPTLLH